MKPVRPIILLVLAAWLGRALPASALETACADGLDEDSDGVADCADSDCVYDPHCALVDFDGDTVANGEDCARLDASVARAPSAPVTGLHVARGAGYDAHLRWDDSAVTLGATTYYDLAIGELWMLRVTRGTVPGASPLALGLTNPAFDDSTPIARGPAPAPADGFWYLVHDGNACGLGPWDDPGLDPVAPWEERGVHCSNGLDDDGDTLIDCDDPDCAREPACCPSCSRPLLQLPDPTTSWQTQAGTMDATCPEAWFSFLLNAGERIELTTCTPGAAAFDSTLLVSDPDCVVLGTSDDACGLQSRVFASATRTGLHHVRVARFDTRILGDYVLAWRLVPNVVCQSCREPDPAVLRPTLTCQTIAGSTDATCPSRYYRVNLTAGRTHQFTTTSAPGCAPPRLCSGSADFNTTLSMHDQNCSLVGANDDCGDTGSFLRYTAPTSGLYLLEVSGASGATGNFTLAFVQEP